MKKVLPILLLLTFVVSNLSAQIPAGGYTLKGSPIFSQGWVFTNNITTAPVVGFNDDEIIMTNSPNETGMFHYGEKRRLFFCDTTLVEFDFKMEPNPSGTSDGFAFWMLTTMGGTQAASPYMGIPINSTGHVVVFDFFDNDANTNNPIITTRTLNNTAVPYTEGVNTANDSTNVNMPFGVWHNVKLYYTFNSATINTTTLSIYVNDILRWQGPGPLNIGATPVDFGFSATSGANQSKLSMKNVSVKPFPLPAEIIIPTYCTDQLVLPFIYPSGGFSVWYDDYNDNTPSLTAPVVDVVQPDTFSYWFGQRKFSNNAFCYGDKQEIVVVVHQAPIVDFDYSKVEGCGADTISFVNLSNTATADLFFWDFDDGTDTSVFQTDHVFASEGNYNVVLRGQNDFCTDSASRMIRLENPFDVSFEISRDSICQNGTIDILNTSAVTEKNGIPTYWKWDFGTAAWDTVITRDPQSKVYFNPGVYNITLTVTNGLPCTDSFTKVVVVDPYPSLNFSRLDTVICQGDDITFDGEVLTEGLNSLTWDFGDGSPSISNSTNFTKSFDVPGVFNVTAVADYRVCPDSVMTKFIKVNPIPQINLPADTFLCYLGEGFDVQDLQNVGNADARYRWSTGDTTRSIRIKNVGTYTATVTIDGCSSSDEMTVDRNCYIIIPNAFSPDNDGINDTFLPRNSSEQNIATFKMQIFNRYGQKIFESERIDAKGWDGKFNGVDQPFGVYVYTIDVAFTSGQTEQYRGNVTLVR